MTISEEALAERIPTSFNQEWMCLFDEGDDEGAFGPKFNHGYGLRLCGELDLTALREALHDVVVRHEVLRTAVVRDQGGGYYQQVRPPCSHELVVCELPGVPAAERAVRAEEFLNEIHGGSYSADDLPLLRGVLGRFDAGDAVLVLIVHHIAADAWSVQQVMHDLMACYARRRGLPAGELPVVSQYQEYARWQRSPEADAVAEREQEYWRRKVGDAEILGLPTDWPRSAKRPKSSAWLRYAVDAELTSAALATARTLRCSLFMLLLSAYEVVLHKRTGATDITVSTFSPGRPHARFMNAVGPFYNFLPLRTDLGACRSFREVVASTRTTCLEAFTHDIPFAQIMAVAPGLMKAWADDNLAVCAFQAVQVPVVTDGWVGTELEYTELRRVISQPAGAEVPDGGIWTLEPDAASGGMIGELGFNTNLWNESTMRDMVAEFGTVLRGALAELDADWRQL